MSSSMLRAFLLWRAVVRNWSFPAAFLARFGEELIEELTEPDLFVPCAEENSIAMKLDELFDAPMPEDVCDVSANPPRLNAGPSEYVKISDGCNRFCSFCAIPFIRGRYHSFSYEAIHVEIAQLVRQGTQEIVLIAQDTGIWGSDLEPKRSLAWLLDSLASAFPTTWFRVLYIQPEHVDEELLDVMVAHENICNYLDIPLQHVDADLLKAMNRSRFARRVPGTSCPYPLEVPAHRPAYYLHRRLSR